MPVLAVAAIPTVASFLMRMGATKAAKKYAPKLLKQARAYIKKNKLILSGNKVIKPKKGSIKTVRPTNKKPTTKKDSFDEALKKKEGAAKFNKLNKTVQTKNPKIKTKNKINKAPKAYVDKFGNPHRTAAGADRANKLNKNPRIKTKNKTKNKKKNKIDDTKTVTNVNKTPVVAPKIKKVAKIGAGLVLGGLAVDQASKVLSNMGKTSDSGPSTFAAAFKKARKEKGPNSTFTYKGKQYSTVTVDQYQKAGFNSLREYLNAQKKK
tara:strand:+ start:1042 stop:1836 length:795 start_codon:yes stop_codon:yes gene_type:complete